MKKIILLLLCGLICGCATLFQDTTVAKDVINSFLMAYQQNDESCSKYILGYNETDPFTFEGISSSFAKKITI